MTPLHDVKVARRSRWIPATDPALGLRKDIAAAIRELDFELDRQHLAETLRVVPPRFHWPILANYKRQHLAVGNRYANLELLETRKAFAAPGVEFAHSDGDIREAAGRRVKDVSNILAEMVQKDRDSVRRELDGFARRHGVEPLSAKKSLRGVIARMTCPRWWRRRLRKAVSQSVERGAIRIGLVHRRKSLYASEEAKARRRDQKRRNGRTLSQLIAVNEDTGSECELAAIVTGSVSNSRVRRAELMARLRGFEDWAIGAGHIGLFLTVTCPSRMHARFARSGAPNPKYDGTDPKQAQDHLVAQWARARAALARRGVFPYGFRIAEPHHDGTPHWHLLLFVRPEHERTLISIIEKYACAADADELSGAAARAARFKAIRIDWSQGSACSYVAKYVAKNIDGHEVGLDYEAGEAIEATESVHAVDAWASTWGIRQFQQIGGPGVTIWRELRRVRQARQGDLFEDIRVAADAGNWRRYIELQGGIEIRRKDRPFGIWMVDAGETRYGEEARKVRGVCHRRSGKLLETRPHRWRLQRKLCAARLRVGAPWTRVNNCTHRGYSRSPIPDFPSPLPDRFAACPPQTVPSTSQEQSWTTHAYKQHRPS